MQHALWIGGAPGAGKTTVASRLARRHGLRLYNADTQTWAHRDRALAAGNEAAARWEAWRHAPTALPDDELLEQSLYRERGQMVVDDVLALPHTPLVIAEGSTVAPSLVAEPGRSLWLIPSPELQAAWLRERDGNAAPLYRLLAAEIERDAHEHGAPVLIVDGSRGIEEMVAAVEQHFATALAAGPNAATAGERRALLREANLAQVAQIRAFYSRPWADGDAESTERTFICECGDTACTADVVATVAAVASGPTLAPGHGEG